MADAADTVARDCDCQNPDGPPGVRHVSMECPIHNDNPFEKETTMNAEAPTVEVMPPPRPWEALPEGTYAIVELMGHTTLVGRVTEVERFGTKLMGIEVLFGGQLLPVILQGGASVYRFTPCPPETAWKAQHQADRMWALPEPIRAIVPAALLPAPAEPTTHRHDDRGDGDDFECTADGGNCTNPEECRGVGHCMSF
jgi:hypothetical protein